MGGMQMTRIMMMMGATKARPCSTSGKESTKSPSGSQYSLSLAAVSDREIAAVGSEKNPMIKADRQMLRACLMKRRRMVRSRFGQIMSPLVGAGVAIICKGAGYSLVWLAMADAVMVLKVTKPVLLMGFPMIVSIVLSTTLLARYLRRSSFLSSLLLPLSPRPENTSRGTFCQRAPLGHLRQQQNDLAFSFFTRPLMLDVSVAISSLAAS
mmetsp:Transcript_6281/g.11940  ORF Transcript_6281/g.11940 Transcript_6281/m.11940 type:complete len:210 (-) Transcript_6281:440-1069(-)